MSLDLLIALLVGIGLHFTSLCPFILHFNLYSVLLYLNRLHSIKFCPFGVPPVVLLLVIRIIIITMIISKCIYYYDCYYCDDFI